MVQFNGPHGKVTVAYLRQGGLNPPAEPPSESFAGKTVAITGCASGIVSIIHRLSVFRRSSNN